MTSIGSYKKSDASFTHPLALGSVQVCSEVFQVYSEVFCSLWSLVWCLVFGIWLVCWSIYFLLVHISGLRWVFYRLNYYRSVARDGSLLCLSFLGKAWIPGNSALKVPEHCNELIPCDRLDVWFEFWLSECIFSLIWTLPLFDRAVKIPAKTWLHWTDISFWSMTWTLFDLWWGTYFLVIDRIFDELIQYSCENSFRSVKCYILSRIVWIVGSSWYFLLISGLNF